MAQEKKEKDAVKTRRNRKILDASNSSRVSLRRSPL
jgi:hypothetical protein